jgi:diguanylate cyclase (GGDEF)-like protein
MKRPEYIQAWEEGSGRDIRYSNTLQVDLLYVAKKLYVAGNEYIIRLAIPMHLLGKMAQHLMAILVVLASVSVALLATSSYISNRQITARVQKEQGLQEERIAQRTYEIELLHRLANMLAACKSIGEAQDVVADLIPRILGDINGSVAIMRSSRNLLEVKLDWGQPWPAAHTYAPEECWSLRKGKFHLTNDDFHCISCSHMSAVGNDQTMCIPLTAHGNTIGMLHLYFGAPDISVDQHTRQLAFTVAEHLGLALANLNMQEKLRFQALSDPLTGLYNRRHFEEQLDLALLNSERDGKEMALLMLDLDHFKRFNDNFGHDAGDYVLKTISNLLVDNAGSEDVVCRLGGEELAIILPNTSHEQALTYSQVICEKVRELHLEMKGLSLGRLGISIGIAISPSDSSDAEHLVKSADIALYDAKEQGRDRAVLYASSVEKKKQAQLSSV